MIEVVGLGRGATVPRGTLVPMELCDLMKAPAYEAVADGMRVGLLGAPEAADPAFRRLKSEADERAINLSVTWGEPLASAMALPPGRTVFGGVEAQPGDLLVPGPGAFAPRRHGLFDPGETLLVFDDVRGEGQTLSAGGAAGRLLTSLSAVYRPLRGQEGSIARLLGVMAALRSPAGCPWDREQDHLSLRRYILEEAAEAVDAIEDGDPEKIREELGDLLLQVVFQARLFDEEGTFGFADVADGLTGKLLRRHPHVFGAGQAKDAADVEKLWEEVKAAESGGQGRSLLALVPRSLAPFERLCAVLHLTSRMGIDAASLPLPVPGLVSEAQRLIGEGLDPAMEVRDAVLLLEAGLGAVDEASPPGGSNARKSSRDRAKTAFFLGIEAKLARKKKD